MKRSEYCMLRGWLFYCAFLLSTLLLSTPPTTGQKIISITLAALNIMSFIEAAIQYTLERKKP